MARSKRKARSAAQVAANRLLGEGWKALTQQKFGRAEHHFRHALRLDANNAEAWHGLGVALHQRGLSSEAYEALHKAIDLNPDVPEVWHALAQVADRLGYTLEALESAERARDLARAQNHPPEVLRGLEITVDALQQALTRLATEMGVRLEDENGREVLRECLRAFQAGLEATQAQNYEVAEARFRECVTLAPENARAWSNLGLVLLLQKRLDEAEEALQRALALRPDYEPARHNLRLLAQLRESPDADLRPLLHQYTDLKHNAPKREAFR